jgi:hypothetical protein
MYYLTEPEEILLIKVSHMLEYTGFNGHLDLSYESLVTIVGIQVVLGGEWRTFPRVSESEESVLSLIIGKPHLGLRCATRQCAWVRLWARFTLHVHGALNRAA